MDKALAPLVSEQEAVRAHPALSRRLARDLLRPLSAYIPLCPRGSQQPRQSHPFCYRSKCPFNKQLVLLLPKMIPKLHPSCSQRLQVLLNMTLAGNFHSWTTFAWLMEQLRLGLRSRSVRLRHAADLYPRPGDSAANSQWHCASGLGHLRQLQVRQPHYSLKCINLTGLPVIHHSDIFWDFLLDGCSLCHFNGNSLELQQILSLNTEPSFLWLGSGMLNAERWLEIFFPHFCREHFFLLPLNDV